MSRDIAKDVPLDVQALCDDYTQRAIKALARVMEAEDTPARSVIDASKVLLSYAHGTPVDRVAVAVHQATPTARNVHLMSNEKLNAHVSYLVEREALEKEKEVDGVIVSQS